MRPRVRYRNTPRGMNGMSTNIRRDSQPVDLDAMLVIGSRAQRRLAKKNLARLEKERARHGG